jgi:hypothetical protein
MARHKPTKHSKSMLNQSLWNAQNQVQINIQLNLNLKNELWGEPKGKRNTAQGKLVEHPPKVT